MCFINNDSGYKNINIADPGSFIAHDVTKLKKQSYDAEDKNYYYYGEEVVKKK